MPQRITRRFLAHDNEGREHTLYVFSEFNLDREKPDATLIQDANGGNLDRKAKGLYEAVVGDRLFTSDDPAAP